MALHLHLHLRFFIRDVAADAGSKPSQPDIRDMWMNCFAEGADLIAFRLYT